MGYFEFSLQQSGSPMSVSFSLNDGVGVFTTVGDVDYEAGLRVLEEGMQEIRASGSPPVLLFDLTQSTENRSREELQMMAVFIHERLPHAKLAMLVKGDLYYGISRMFGSFAESYDLETCVFREMDDALVWCLARARVTH